MRTTVRSRAVRRLLAVAAAVAAAVAIVGAAPGAAARPASPPTVVVAPHGSDDASGTAAHPLAHLQVALARVQRTGGLVLLRTGVYHQRITVRHAHDVTVQPYPHEHAVLSGAGLTAPTGRSAMVDIADSRRITIRGLEITGYRTKAIHAMPIGVYVHGGDTGIRITEDHVHDLGNDNGTLGSFDLNAHGIAAYGDDPHHPITDLRIDHDVVDHLHLGASESVVVNGDVDGWRITDDRIFRNNNIGIDAIGFEPTLSGRYRYTETNRARNGLIADNTVSDIRSKGNPSYFEDGGWCNCADGIYVDGGTRIRIRDNEVAGNDIGIEVAAENARGNASHVVVQGNHVTGSLYTGITTGGYCDGHADCGGVQTGSSYDNVFVDNVLRGNNRLNDGSPELLVQYRAHDDRFLHNSITATDSDHVVYGTVPRDRGGAGDVSDGNRFAATGAGPGGLRFGWRGSTWTGFAAYRAATGQDRHSVVVDAAPSRTPARR